MSYSYADTVDPEGRLGMGGALVSSFSSAAHAGRPSLFRADGVSAEADFSGDIEAGGRFDPALGGSWWDRCLNCAKMGDVDDVVRHLDRIFEGVECDDPSVKARLCGLLDEVRFELERSSATPNCVVALEGYYERMDAALPVLVPRPLSPALLTPQSPALLS